MKFVKGRWFPLIMAIITALVTGIVLFFCGFRITYAPELENRWEAISAVAAWAGVIMSFIAILFAIWVPFAISKRQDRIALFERRMQCYSTLQNILAFARQISDIETKKGMHTAFKIYFSGADSFAQDQSFSWYAITLKRQEGIIVEGAFLFPRYNEETPQDVLMQMIELARLVSTTASEKAEQSISDDIRKHRDSICSTCKNLENTLIPLMEKELRL